MEGAYAESSVKRENNFKITLYKALIIAADVLMFMGGLFLSNSILIFVAIIASVLTFVFFPYFNVEYECVYVNGQFDFAMIMNGSRRKNLLTIDLDNAEILALSSSHALDSQRSMRMAEKSFVSGREDARVYTLVGKDNNGDMVRVNFEPSEKILDLVRSNPKYRRKFSEV